MLIHAGGRELVVTGNKNAAAYAIRTPVRPSGKRPDSAPAGQAAADGKKLWEYDTATPIDTVNGVKAAPGGSLSGGGPTIAGGRLFIHYGWDGSAGASNLLLAFTVDGK